MNTNDLTIGTRVTLPALPASKQKTGTIVSLHETRDYTDAAVRWDDGTVDEVDTGWLARETSTLALARPAYVVVRTFGNEDGPSETEVVGVARTAAHAKATRARMSRQDDYEFVSYEVRFWNGRFYDRQTPYFAPVAQPVYEGEIPL